MKYIIDVPEDMVIKSAVNGLTLGIPILVSATQKEYILPTNIKIKPYTEPDRKAIEDEVWEFCMNTDWSWISEAGTKPLKKYSYQEAKTKYEAWKKQKDEIRVGNEVEYVCGDETVRFVVIGLIKGKAYGFKYPCDYDDVGEYCDIDMLRKTGRHFDEAEELLKKMKEEP